MALPKELVMRRFPMTLDKKNKALTVLTDAKDAAKAIPTDSTQRFAAGMADLSRRLQTAGQDIAGFFGRLDSEFKGTELRAAFYASAECRSL